MKILCKWFGHLRPLRLARNVTILECGIVRSELTGWKCLFCNEFWSEQWDW